MSYFGSSFFVFRQLSPSFIGLLSLLACSGLSADQALPELNDSASQVLNAEDEIILGRKLMADARSRLNLIGDPILLNYVHNLTAELASHSSRPLPDVHVSLVLNPVINAFAVPGGQIAINTGLLTATQSEGELASVIAHEISHHSQRHIPRMLENAKKISLPSTAAILGGLLIGGQAGVATIAAVRAAVISNQLAYSRGFEKEADAAGMKLLASAGYDPINMPIFFGRLERQSQIQGSEIPEFLRTHPLSNNRIAEAKARVQSLNLYVEDRVELNTLLNFKTAQARSNALYGEPLKQIISSFRAALSKAADAESFHNAYGLALALMRDGNTEEAAQVLSQHYSSAQLTDLAQLTQAEILLKADKKRAALALLNKLIVNHPKNLAVGLTRARTLKRLDLLDDAFQQARKTMRAHPRQPQISLLLADIAGAVGNLPDAALNKAQFYYDLGHYPKATSSLAPYVKNANAKISPYLHSRIKDLQKQISTASARASALGI